MKGREKIILIVLGTIVVLGILSLFGMAAYQLGRSQQPTIIPSPTPEASPSVKLTPTWAVTLTPASTLQPTVDETSLIREAVFKKTGLDESTAEVTISQNTGKHAKGGIKEFEAVGGAYWLAAKTDDGWICVYDGQANPTCSQIAPYNFPNSLVPECLDAGGKVVKR